MTLQLRISSRWTLIVLTDQRGRHGAGLHAGEVDRRRLGRAEIWYTTITDQATGAGMWFHHELIAPADRAVPFTRGHVAVFPPGDDIAFESYGPEPWTGAAGFVSGPVSFDGERTAGAAGKISWELACATASPPLSTFPAWVWRTRILSAARMVPVPAGRFTGVVRVGDYELRLLDAPGATGRIYGHGKARRWGWLHADLGGGDVLEVVAAIARRPPLNRVPTLVFVRLRVDGREWPGGDQLLVSRGPVLAGPADHRQDLATTARGTGDAAVRRGGRHAVHRSRRSPGQVPQQRAR